GTTRLGREGSAGGGPWLGWCQAIEPAREGGAVAPREHDALGEAANPNTFRTLAYAPGLALRAGTAAVRGLAADHAPDEAPVDSTAHLAHDAGVLVAEHQGRFPGEQPLRRVDVGATDAGGMNGHHDLARPGDGPGHLA